MVRVKICGITREEHLRAAVEAGAAAIGLVVESNGTPRNLTIEEARNLRRRTPPFVDAVLVSSCDKLAVIQKVVEKIHPDFVQLHGIKDVEKLSALERGKGVGIIVPVSIGSSYAKREQELELITKFTEIARGLLLDASTSKIGGLGKRGDWIYARQIRDAVYPFPVILSGGLNPTNVSEAIKQVAPYAVDVSSGVESIRGVKDPTKIFEFIREAHGAIV